VQGFTDETLINFELSLTNPSTLAEQEKINIWKEKFALAQQMTGGQAQLLSQDWVYNNILEMSDEEVVDERKKIEEDIKRVQQQMAAAQPDLGNIEQGGEQPVVPPETGESPEQTEAPSDEMESGDEQEAQIDTVDKILQSLEDVPDEEDEDLEEALIKNKGGRPREGLKFGTDRHPFGRDPLGHKENKKSTKRSSLSFESADFIRKLSDKFANQSQYKKIISESISNDEKTEG
jgi:hypothetical protein